MHSSTGSSKTAIVFGFKKWDLEDYAIISAIRNEQGIAACFAVFF